MFHFLAKCRRVSTHSKNFLNDLETQEAIRFILNNPKETFVPWVKEKFPLGDNLIYLIGKLRQQQKWDQITSILPLVNRENCQNLKLYLSLVSMFKKVEVSKDFSEHFLDLVARAKDHLSLRELSECFRCLKYLNLTTKEKFSVIDLLSARILINIPNFTSIDKSYIIEGISLLPCESTSRIFEGFVKDSKVKSIGELSTLCSFLSINRNKEFFYLFEEFERELMKDRADNKFVLNQAIHGFSKVGLGSKELLRYFIEKVWQGKDEIDGFSTGVILCCLIKDPRIDSEDRERIRSIFESKKVDMREKHLRIIREHL